MPTPLQYAKNIAKRMEPARKSTPWGIYKSNEANGLIHKYGIAGFTAAFTERSATERHSSADLIEPEKLHLKNVMKLEKDMSGSLAKIVELMHTHGQIKHWEKFEGVNDAVADQILDKEIDGKKVSKLLKEHIYLEPELLTKATDPEEAHNRQRLRYLAAFTVMRDGLAQVHADKKAYGAGDMLTKKSMLTAAVIGAKVGATIRKEKP